MRNPRTWDLFCSMFDDIVSECLPYHNNIIERFSNDEGCFDGSPNILFYNSEGFPTDLLIDYMFRKIHGPFTRIQCQVNADMEYFQTQWFIEFDFHHPNFAKQSTECIELIKQIIQSPSVDGARHVILFKNIDGALKVSKQMFRVLLERYSKNALFICTTTSIAKLEPPVKSRFTLVRIPLPTICEMKLIIRKLGLALEDQYINRNLFKTILILDILACIKVSNAQSSIDSLCRFHYPPLGEIQGSAAVTLESMRTMANKICQTNIPVRSIVLDLLQLIPNDQHKYIFTQIAADIEHMMARTNGGRQILYIENLLQAAMFEPKTKSVT